ncbi:MAG TPA: MerR family DNA-binding transcriptional regulator, partial [Roseiarcus sp.]|nr:MerR family DNA-binding transcriptional regulator [Roseiarcus sp.]
MLARWTPGVGVETVRFYERKGLIDPPRSADGYREYGDEALGQSDMSELRSGWASASRTWRSC